MKGSLAKFVSDEVRGKLLAATGAQEGDALLFGAGETLPTCKTMGKLRNYVGERVNLQDPSKVAFCWIVDYPMFEWNEDENKIDFSHNPFKTANSGFLPVLWLPAA